MALQSKGSILAAVKATLESLAYAADEDLPAGIMVAGDKRFEKVVLFDVLSIEDALEKTFSFGSRLALVVPGDESWERVGENGGNQLAMRRVLPVAVVMLDRNYSGVGKAAFFGDGETFAGIFDRTPDAVITALFGSALELPGVVCEPASGYSIRVAKDKSNIQNGREGYIQFFNLSCGTLTDTLSRGRRPLR